MSSLALHRDDTKAVRRATPSAGRPPLLTTQAFHEAIELHGPAVFRYATAQVGPGGAEDVVAETFAAAWSARAKFVDPSDNGLEAWLIAIARNVSAAHRRREKRWLRMCADAVRQRADASSVSDEDDADDRADAMQLARTADVAELVARLPDREREPLLLHVLHGRTYSEIAEILGVPLGTVQSRISRGRRRLATSLRRTKDGRP